MQYRVFIHNVLQDASQIALEYFGKVSAIQKEGDNAQIITKANIKVGNYILQEIQKEFPHHNSIEEETDVINNNAAYTWVIDPIAGANNFSNGVPQFGIMIGLLQDSLPIAGGIALPYYSKILSSEKHEGAFCNGEQVHVTKEQSLLHALVAYHIDGWQDDPSVIREEVAKLGEILLHIRDLRISDTSYDMALVAQGNYGGYVNKKSKVWDNVAPHSIIEEAGGIYTDYYGKQMNYTGIMNTPQQLFTCCTGAPVLHQQLQHIIHTPR